MPSKNHNTTIENHPGDDSNEATALLLNNSSTNSNVDEIGNYQGFNGSLDQDIEVLGIETTFEGGKRNQQSNTVVPNQVLNYESEVDI